MDTNTQYLKDFFTGKIVKHNQIFPNNPIYNIDVSLIVNTSKLTDSRYKIAFRKLRDKKLIMGSRGNWCFYSIEYFENRAARQLARNELAKIGFPVLKTRGMNNLKTDDPILILEWAKSIKTK